MPHADYVCARCGRRDNDVIFRMALGATEDSPGCQDCGNPRMEVVPQIGAMDAGSGSSFKAFSTHVNGRYERIDSLHTLRRVERESEQAYRNGEGEPVRFRMWNQDRTNKDQNSFGASGSIGDQQYASGDAPTKKLEVGRHAQAPRRGTGPGVAKGGVTALKG